MAYPQSLEAAFESASTYREAHTAISTLSGSAYATTSTGRSSARGRGRGRGRGRDQIHKDTGSESRASTPTKCT